MPSTSECLQPYLLSNFDLVTESFTLIAGNFSVAVSTDKITCHSSASSSLAAGTSPAASNSAPLCTSSVASPPSSRSMFGPSASGQVSACSVHHQYSGSVSPFQAKTGTPFGLSVVPSGPTATAAAAWSWVEKMLQLAQRTCAPSATRVSISTAVWIVMCSEPVILAPASGWELAYSARTDIRPGISCSASRISRRPKSASERSATLKGRVCPGIRAPRGVVFGLAPVQGRQDDATAAGPPDARP